MMQTPANTRSDHSGMIVTNKTPVPFINAHEIMIYDEY
jgi:hypothetical protein